MYQRVDLEQTDKWLEGFSYLNDSGDEEFVHMTREDNVRIKDSFGDTVAIYYADIPKLVLALESAYKHNKENV